jgi:hypothetical protein
MHSADSQLPTYSLNNAVTEVIGTDAELADSIHAHLDQDEFIRLYLPYLQDTMLLWSDDVSVFLEKYALSADGLVYVPADNELRVSILRGCHDSRMAGHLGQKNTLEQVSRNYYWPRM